MADNNVPRWTRLKQGAAILFSRTRKSDGSSNRSHERYRLATLYGLSSLVNRAISLAVNLLTVRLTFAYLGSERFGMLMTITSLVTMFGFADFGLSNGLINMVAEAVGKDLRSEAREITSSAACILGIVAFALIAIGAVVYPHVNMAALFNVHSPAAMKEAGPALAVFAICFLAQLPLGVVRGTQTGLQKGYINNSWAILGSILSLIALLVGIRYKVSLALLMLSLGAPPLLALLLNGGSLFLRSHPELRPALRSFSWQIASRVLHTGSMYFILQIAFSIGVQTDNVVIAQLIGAKAVSEYAVPARMFNSVTTLLVMMSGVFLPAYADAFARSDGQWIRRTFMRVSILSAIVAIAAALCLVIWGNAIIRLWVGPQIHASFALLVSFALLSVVYAYLQPINFLLNGIRRFNFTVISSIVGAFTNLGLSILLVKRFGIVGAVLGTLISYVVVQVIPLTIAARRALRDLSSDPLAEYAG